MNGELELAGNCCIIFALIAGAILIITANLKDIIDYQSDGEGFIDD